MNRRDFLKRLAAIAAASQVPLRLPAEDLPSPVDEGPADFLRYSYSGGEALALPPISLSLTQPTHVMLDDIGGYFNAIPVGPKEFSLECYLDELTAADGLRTALYEFGLVRFQLKLPGEDLRFAARITGMEIDSDRRCMITGYLTDEVTTA